MLSLIIGGLIAIITSLILYKLISGFLYDVTLRRLAKASFVMSSGDIAELLFGYFVGMLSFLFINSFMKSVFSVQNPNGLANSNESVILIGLMMLYVGRIITRRQGIFFGKLHFSAILITSSIIFFMDVISKGNLDLSGSLINDLTVYSPANIYITLINVVLSFIDYLFEGNSILSKTIYISAFGVIYLAILGEWFLARLPMNATSLLTIAEKLPSNFVVIHDETKINKFIKEDMFSGRIVYSKCATRALRFMDFIERPIREQSEANGCSSSKNYILVAPYDKAEADYRAFIKSLPWSIFNILKKEGELVQKFKSEYQQRSSLLRNLKHDKLAISKEGYCGDLIFLITRNDQNQRKILFLVREKSTLNGRVGLYTIQPYIINIFEKFFDESWSPQPELDYIIEREVEATHPDASVMGLC